MFKFVATFSVLGLLIVAVAGSYTPVMARSYAGKAWSTNPIAADISLSSRPMGSACSQRAWPYYESMCVRDGRPLASELRKIRVITIDQQSTGRTATKSPLKI